MSWDYGSGGKGGAYGNSSFGILQKQMQRDGTRAPGGVMLTPTKRGVVTISAPGRSSTPGWKSKNPYVFPANWQPPNSMADWNNAVNAYKAQADAQNADKWASLQGQLQGLYSDASGRRIQADFSKLEGGIDNTLAAQLAATRNQEGGLDDAYYDNAANSARVLFDQLNAGATRDEEYTKAQYGFIQRALDEARAAADTTLKEGGQTRDENIRNIAASSGAAGSYFSSGRLLDDKAQADQYGIVANRVDQSKVQAQREWEQAHAELDKRLADIGGQRDKFKLDLWDTTVSANTNKQKSALGRWNAEMQSQADQKKRALADQQNQAQLANFYKGIQQQQDQLRWQMAMADFNNRQTAFYQAIAAGLKPPAPPGVAGGPMAPVAPTPLGQKQRAAIDRRRR